MLRTRSHRRVDHELAHTIVDRYLSAGLPVREQPVIRLLFMTRAQIGVSQMQVSQLLSRSLIRLRHAIQADVDTSTYSNGPGDLARRVVDAGPSGAVERSSVGLHRGKVGETAVGLAGKRTHVGLRFISSFLGVRGVVVPRAGGSARGTATLVLGGTGTAGPPGQTGVG